MTRAQGQAEIEKLVGELGAVVTRLTNLIAAGEISGGYRFKSVNGKMQPDVLVEAEVLRVAALEMLVLLTGDYDDQTQYESWNAVLVEHKASLEKRHHRWEDK